MGPTLNQLSELQKNQLDALHAAGSTLVNAIEKVTNLYLASTRSVLEGAGQASLACLQEPQKTLSVFGEMVQPATAHFAGVARDLLGIACATQAELSRIAESRLATGNGKVAEIVEVSLQGAPAGTESTVAFVRQALSASQSAYDAMARATRQAVEFAESNLAAVSAATAEAGQATAH